MPDFLEVFNHLRGAGNAEPSIRWTSISGQKLRSVHFTAYKECRIGQGHLVPNLLHVALSSANNHCFILWLSLFQAQFHFIFAHVEPNFIWGVDRVWAMYTYVHVLMEQVFRVERAEIWATGSSFGAHCLGRAMGMIYVYFYNWKKDAYVCVYIWGVYPWVLTIDIIWRYLRSFWPGNLLLYTLIIRSTFNKWSTLVILRWSLTYIGKADTFYNSRN